MRKTYALIDLCMTHIAVHGLRQLRIQPTFDDPVLQRRRITPTLSLANCFAVLRWSTYR
jgi:hypothetical protein